MDPAARAQLDIQVGRLASGDRSALEPVYRTLWPVLNGWAKRLVPPAEADDATQEALLKLFFRASEYDPARDALSWALGILSYQLLTERKRARRSRGHEGPAPEPVDFATPEAALLQAERDAAFAELQGNLSELDAATLRASLGGTPALGVAPATFRKRLQRAVERARRTWRLVHGDD